MNRVYKYSLIILFVVILLLLLTTIASPMGNGDKTRIAKMKDDIIKMSAIELKDKYQNKFTQIEFSDGLVTGICDDSHSSYFGGNMVIKANQDPPIEYMGHVCGNGYLATHHSAYKATMKAHDKELHCLDFVDYLRQKLNRGIQ